MNTSLENLQNTTYNNGLQFATTDSLIRQENNQPYRSIQLDEDENDDLGHPAAVAIGAWLKGMWGASTAGTKLGVLALGVSGTTLAITIAKYENDKAVKAKLGARKEKLLDLQIQALKQYINQEREPLAKHNVPFELDLENDDLGTFKVHSKGYRITSGNNDRFHGDDNNDYFDGQGGDDFLRGLGGHDFMYGNDGNDTLEGGAGNDRLIGGRGNDDLIGEKGDDLLFGGEGNDNLIGGEGHDKLDGGKGNDNLIGGLGNDFLNGGDGNDNLLGGQGSDLLLGGKGDDVLTGGEGNDTLVGGQGNDILFGMEGTNIIFGGKGNDTFGGSLNGQDIIKDFTFGEDRIRIGETWTIGTAPFSTDAAIYSGTDVHFVLEGIGIDQATTQLTRTTEGERFYLA